MKNVIVFIVFYLITSCNQNILSENHFKYTESIEKINFDISKGYDCEKNGMFNRLINFKISHETIETKLIRNLKLRVSWREYIYFDNFNNGDFSVIIPFCKKDQIPFVLTIDLIDEKNNIIYIWSVKNPIELWNNDFVTIELKENGEYYFK